MTRHGPVALLALMASFAVAGYAGVRLLSGNPVGVGAWLVVGVVVHDLLLFPFYAGVDAALVTLLRHRPALATVAGVPWLNYLRVPAVVSGVLLLVWSPLILRVPTAYQEASGRSAQPVPAALVGGDGGASRSPRLPWRCASPRSATTRRGAP